MAEATIAKGMWCHVEIPSQNPAKSQAFYEGLFDWSFQVVPMGPEGKYHLYQTGEGGIGGGIFTPPEGMPQQLINYVSVEEIEPIAEKAVANGGKVIVPMQEVPNTGWFSILADPDGNCFGIWKQNPQGH